MSLEQGTPLGSYQILAPIGAGGMGEVYQARDTKLGRDVAIKVLPEDFSQDKDCLARFEREARVLASLNHPNIAAIYGFEDSDGVQFIVVELVDGETLAERIARGPILVDEALPLFKQIAEALEAAHEKGIIHRDLKPANIKVTPEGTVKVLDFGLAKALGGEEADADLSNSPTLTRAATREGVILGTAAYMSPEQAKGKKVDRRTDVWAFGCVLYETLTGQKPFEGETVSETLASILKEEPDWERLPAETPRKLEALLTRCLWKDARSRLRDVGDARVEIEEVLAGDAGGPEMLAPTVQATWRRILPWGTATVFILTALLIGFFAGKDARREEQVVRAEISPPVGSAFNIEGAMAGGPVLSPDGRRLAFSARDAEGEVRLYVRSLDDVEAYVLSGTEGGSSPFWSPDGRWVGFFADGKLKKIETAGGAPLTLSDAPDPRGGSWSSEGVIVFAPDRSSTLHRVSETGGESTPLTELDSKGGEISHRQPRFLPDGDHFFYMARTGASPGGNILVGSLDGDDAKLLTHSLAAVAYSSGYLLFQRETTLMAQPFDVVRLELAGEAFPIAENLALALGRFASFSAAKNVLVYQIAGKESEAQLEWLDRAGSHQGTLGDPAPYFDVHLSPDGKNAVVGIMDPGAGFLPDLWIYEIARNLRTRFTFDPGFETYAVWFPDGKTLAFASNRKGYFDLFWKSLGGSAEAELLLESDTLKRPSDCSPDGKLIVYSQRDEQTGFDIWLLPLSGERKPYTFLQTRFNENWGQFSPDGHWMAYISDESGRNEVYVTPFPGPGRKWQISTNGGEYPWWRQDGKEVLYQEESGRLMAAEVSARGDTFEVALVTPLFETTPWLVAPTSDAQRFLVARRTGEETPTPLTLVVNWTAELKP